MVRTKDQKRDDDKRFLRFRKAVEAAMNNEGYMPPEWAGDLLILRLMLQTKELAVVHRKAEHGCYNFSCPECDQ